MQVEIYIILLVIIIQVNYEETLKIMFIKWKIICKMWPISRVRML